jgi:hypothetical protein
VRRPPLRLLRLANPFVRAVLRSPFHRLASGSLVLVTFARGDGSERVIPVMYEAVDGRWVTLASAPERKRWWRAFRHGAPATLLVAGTAVAVEGRLLEGDEARDALGAWVRRFPRGAGPLGLGRDPSSDDLARAAEGAAVVAFTPAAAQPAR